MQGKLEAAQAAAASSDQMIRWLNSQLTETQLHGGSRAGPALLASRYSFGAGGAAPPLAGPICRPAACAGRVGEGTAAPKVAGAGIPAMRPPSYLCGGGSSPRCGPFRSNFYATHFGGGAGITAADVRPPVTSSSGKRAGPPLPAVTSCAACMPPAHHSKAPPARSAATLVGSTPAKIVTGAA